jgi:hypothetical protein
MASIREFKLSNVVVSRSLMLLGPQQCDSARYWSFWFFGEVISLGSLEPSTGPTSISLVGRSVAESGGQIAWSCSEQQSEIQF